MEYLAVKDLKRSRDLWDKLKNQHELVVTKDGTPCALLVGITPETLEESISEIRKALFSVAVANMRKKVSSNPPDESEIQALVGKSRSQRKNK
ncbi:MAG: hypothetical protein JW969_13905 [Spirochaetales bacterium]|nr:hypothetical protein [Spirochaetales bacterium]